MEISRQKNSNTQNSINFTILILLIAETVMWKQIQG